MSEGFLLRWSHLKDAARQAERPANALAGEGPSAKESGEAEVTPEALASLPRIEELTAETDITGFLHKGIPAELRNAALRKAWLLDPAIRNFEGHARDYAYDWNVPGGVPGSGGALRADEVAATVRNLFGNRQATAASPPEEAAPATHDEAAKESVHDEAPPGESRT